ncbi:MAG: M23 family metallopeptidase [Sandaracinaceae bacterium]|nr:M23 family metallopeptidase [Sandaracinaceae bacterium]
MRCARGSSRWCCSSPSPPPRARSRTARSTRRSPARWPRPRPRPSAAIGSPRRSRGSSRSAAPHKIGCAPGCARSIGSGARGCCPWPAASTRCSGTSRASSGSSASPRGTSARSARCARAWPRCRRRTRGSPARRSKPSARSPRSASAARRSSAPRWGCGRPSVSPRPCWDRRPTRRGARASGSASPTPSPRASRRFAGASRSRSAAAPRLADAQREGGAGLELSAAQGTGVRSVGAGRVAYAAPHPAYGRLVILDHGDGYYTVYGGLGVLAVQVGQSLTADAPLGSIGGQPLFFQVRRGTRPLPAREWLGI